MFFFSWCVATQLVRSTGASIISGNSQNARAPCCCILDAVEGATNNGIEDGNNSNDNNGNNDSGFADVYYTFRGLYVFSTHSTRKTYRTIGYSYDVILGNTRFPLGVWLT